MNARALYKYRERSTPELVTPDLAHPWISSQQIWPCIGFMLNACQPIFKCSVWTLSKTLLLPHDTDAEESAKAMAPIRLVWLSRIITSEHSDQLSAHRVSYRGKAHFLLATCSCVRQPLIHRVGSLEPSGLDG